MAIATHHDQSRPHFAGTPPQGRADRVHRPRFSGKLDRNAMARQHGGQLMPWLAPMLWRIDHQQLDPFGLLENWQGAPRGTQRLARSVPGDHHRLRFQLPQSGRADEDRAVPIEHRALEGIGSGPRDVLAIGLRQQRKICELRMIPDGLREGAEPAGDRDHIAADTCAVDHLARTLRPFLRL